MAEPIKGNLHPVMNLVHGKETDDSPCGEDFEVTIDRQKHEAEMKPEDCQVCHNGEPTKDNLRFRDWASHYDKYKEIIHDEKKGKCIHCHVEFNTTGHGKDRAEKDKAPFDCGNDKCHAKPKEKGKCEKDADPFSTPLIDFQRFLRDGKDVKKTVPAFKAVMTFLKE